MRKPVFGLCKNKDADQLRSDCEAVQRLCFHYSDSTLPPLLISQISSFLPSSVTAQAGLCQTWSETQIVGFLMQRLIFSFINIIFEQPYVACCHALFSGAHAVFYYLFHKITLL